MLSSRSTGVSFLCQRSSLPCALLEQLLLHLPLKQRPGRSKGSGAQQEPENESQRPLSLGEDIQTPKNKYPNGASGGKTI